MTRIGLATVCLVAGCSSARVMEAPTPIPLVDNHATTHDRVDVGHWLRIDRPSSPGKLVFEVRLQPDVALVVHDRDGHPIASSIESHAGVMTYTVDPAPPQVLVMATGTARSYDLDVRFVAGVDWRKESIPGPPDLPAVPQPWCSDAVTTNCRREPCDWSNINADNPACDVRRMPPSCDVSPPDPAYPACAATMPCPTPADPRVKRCATTPVPSTPIFAVIDRVDDDGSGKLTLHISAGALKGIASDWHAVVVVGDADRAVPGGVLDIVRVDPDATVGRVRLTKRQLEGKTRVRFTAP